MNTTLRRFLCDVSAAFPADQRDMFPDYVSYMPSLYEYNAPRLTCKRRQSYSPSHP